MKFDTELEELKELAKSNDSFSFDGGCWREAVTSHFSQMFKPIGVYILRASDKRVLYVGKGGTVKGYNEFGKQTLPGRLKNVRGKNEETDKYISSQQWMDEILKESGAVTIEYLLFERNASLAPAYAEACLLQAYRNDHGGRLPPKNQSF